MLRDKIVQTKQMVTETRDSLAKENQIKREKEFAELIDSELPELMKTVVSVRSMEKMFPKQFIIPDMKEALRFTQDLILNMKYQAKERFGDIIRTIESLKKDAQRQWSEFARKHHEETNKTLLLMKQIHRNDTSIDQYVQVLTSFETLWPITEAQLKHYENTMQQAKDHLASMEASASVQIFLEKISGGAATLIDLNDEVLDWIKKKNLSSQIYITVK